jgi:mercuric ion transport protein
VSTPPQMAPPPRPQDRWSLGSIAGAAFAALLGSLCCIGPLLFASLGIGGAGILVKLERYRALFAIATLLGLGAGFYFSYRKPKAVAQGDACGCELTRTRRIGRALLWIGTVLVIGIWSFPYLADRLLG